MMGHNYNYFYPPPPPPTVPPPPLPALPPVPVQVRPPPLPLNGCTTEQWNNWPTKPPQIIQDFSKPPPPIAGNHQSYLSNYGTPPSKPVQVYNQQTVQNNSQHYPSRSPRYNSNNQYNGSPQQSWQRNQNSYKKPRLEADVFEPKTKGTKKKKPLSQSMPTRRAWSMADAQRALTLERDYNKRCRNHSLIIKFPDHELNKEIVSKFHHAIENVHFQQPSTARFCFVTLQPTADADTVINELNKQRFGDGFLCAEYKKDRDEDQILQPTEIDPLTLYVGNLAQEVTKEDMLRTYPRSRRIDIGYAKKMKYTRYAFVTFVDAEDSLRAFKRTHSTEMYSKSLIVRFRRINGTVGMPGEPKPQNPSRTVSESTSESLEDLNGSALLQGVSQNGVSAAATADSLVNKAAGSGSLDLSCVKDEPKSDDEDDARKLSAPRYESPFGRGCIETAWANHKPIAVKTEIKSELIKVERPNENHGQMQQSAIKNEPVYKDLDADGDLSDDNFDSMYRNESDNEDIDDIDEPERVTDFDGLYRNMVTSVNIINSLKHIRP